MRNNQEPFGSLSTGAQITGIIDGVCPTHRTGIVEAEIGDDWSLTAQDSPDLISIEGDGVDLENVSLDQLNRLRALLATTIPEQLIAAAVSYGRGDAAPDERRQIAAEADRVLAEHYAQQPECRAIFDALSPELAGRFVEMVEKYGPDAVEQALDAAIPPLRSALGVPIGEIAGEIVTGDYGGDDGRDLFGANLHWNGLNLRTDGVGFLELGTGEACDFFNQMTIQEWGRVRELAQTDVIEQLIALARAKARLA